MSENSAEKYRGWAAQCLSLAEGAQRDDDKATWLELAGKWQRLSEEERNHVTQLAQQPQSLALEEAAMFDPTFSTSGLNKAVRPSCGGQMCRTGGRLPA